MSRSISIIGIAIVIFLSISSVSADMIEDSKVIGVSGGEFHSLVVTQNGWAWACGDNFYYQLGTGDYQEQTWLVRVHDGNMFTESGYLENITQVSAGFIHSLALDFNGILTKFQLLLGI